MTANYNPIRSGKVKNPRVRSVDILIWISKSCPKYVTARMVAEEFWPDEVKRRAAEASSRLLTLQKWGCLNVRVPNKGDDKEGSRARHKVYYLSDFGKEKSEIWEAEGAPRWRKF